MVPGGLCLFIVFKDFNTEDTENHGASRRGSCRLGLLFGSGIFGLPDRALTVAAGTASGCESAATFAFKLDVV